MGKRGSLSLVGRRRPACEIQSASQPAASSRCACAQVYMNLAVGIWPAGVAQAAPASPIMESIRERKQLGRPVYWPAASSFFLYVRRPASPPAAAGMSLRDAKRRSVRRAKKKKKKQKLHLRPLLLLGCLKQTISRARSRFLNDVGCFLHDARRPLCSRLSGAHERAESESERVGRAAKSEAVSRAIIPLDSSAARQPAGHCGQSRRRERPITKAASLDGGGSGAKPCAAGGADSLLTGILATLTHR